MIITKEQNQPETLATYSISPLTSRPFLQQGKLEGDSKKMLPPF